MYVTYTSVLGASLYFASRMTVAQERDRDVLTQVKHSMTQVKHHTVDQDRDAGVQQRASAADARLPQSCCPSA
jgi:hypothetical protein